MKFIGRVEELSKLETEYKRDSGFVVIYGRRRVGKTTLIKQFLKKRKQLLFSCNGRTGKSEHEETRRSHCKNNPKFITSESIF